MHFSLRPLRLLAIVMVLSMIAVACGGSDDTPEAVQDAPAAGTPEPIATTPPLDATFEDDPETVIDTETDTADLTVVEGDDLGPTTEFETIVLKVKDEVHAEQTIPVFSAPTGAEADLMTLLDINAIDNIEYEYPLTGTTYFGNRLALMVKEYDITGNYANVYAPVRPNGTTVWVQTAFFEEIRHEYRVEVHVPTNTVRVYNGAELIKESSAVTGRDSRPTPVLRSYIDEKIPGPDIGPAFGSWILSVAAYSESLGTFGTNGGTPKLALHGTNQEDLIGQNVSSGCVRLPNEIIEFMADTLPVGTPVDFIR